MKKRFTEEQIIQVLREHEASGQTAEVCRRHGISPATFYNWKAKYGGMDVSEAKKLRAVSNSTALVCCLVGSFIFKEQMHIKEKICAAAMIIGIAIISFG
jgi:putative transposase